MNVPSPLLLKPPLTADVKLARDAGRYLAGHAAEGVPTVRGGRAAMMGHAGEAHDRRVDEARM